MQSDARSEARPTAVDCMAVAAARQPGRRRTRRGSVAVCRGGGLVIVRLLLLALLTLLAAGRGEQHEGGAATSVHSENSAELVEHEGWVQFRRESSVKGELTAAEPEAEAEPGPEPVVHVAIAITVDAAVLVDGSPARQAFEVIACKSQSGAAIFYPLHNSTAL